MKIAIDASRANRREKTGVEWYAYNVILNLAKIADPNDRFILYFQDEPENAFKNLPKNFELKILKWPLKYIWTHIRLSFELFIDKPDILFIPAHVIPKYHPKNTVITLHDIAFKRFPQAYSKKHEKYHDISTNYAVKNAKKIIVPSSFTKKELIHFYKANPDNINIVYNGFSSHEFKRISETTLKNQILQKYKIKEDYFLYTGRLEEKKNIIGIIKSFEKYKNNYKTSHKLVLIGKPGYNFNLIAEKINSSAYKEDILTPGWVDQNDLPALYNCAKIFLYPTKYEGFGIPILEAMACGIPVITSKYTANSEIADNAALLVNPDDYTQISDSINILVTSHELRNTLINRGFERITHFNWEKCAQEVYNILKNLR